jgi:flagellar biosynthesis protein FliR/FlhB
VSEKTEQPTHKKLQDARKKGQVAKSQKLTLVMGMAGGLLGLILAVSLAKPYVLDSIRESLSISNALQNDSGHWIKQLAMPVLLVLLPLFVFISVGIVLATFLQTKGLVTFEQMKPKWESLSGVSYFKRYASSRPIVEALLMFAFTACFLAICYWIFKGQMPVWIGSFGVSAESALKASEKLIINVLGYFLLIALILAALDFAYQYFQYLKDQKMTKDEVKREYKNQEGDPLIKGMRRSIAREIANSTRQRNLKRATLVVTNPTHLAIVLQADADHPIPYVVMKGADQEALEIKLAAKRAKVPVIEHKLLARKLMKSNEENTPIPRETYGLVAKLLVTHCKTFVEQMQNQNRKARN